MDELVENDAQKSKNEKREENSMGSNLATSNLDKMEIEEDSMEVEPTDKNGVANGTKTTQLNSPPPNSNGQEQTIANNEARQEVKKSNVENNQEKVIAKSTEKGTAKKML